MTAAILNFPRKIAGNAGKKRTGTFLTPAWAAQHLPLIDAASDLFQANEREFKQRCRHIVQTEGASVLEQLTAQLDRLSAHVADVVTILRATASRVRKFIAAEGLAP